MDGRGLTAAYKFYFDARDARKLYETYFKGNAGGLPHLSTQVRSAIQQLGEERNWKAMAEHLNAARLENQTFINEMVLPDFAETPEYQQFKAKDDAGERSPLSRMVGAMRRGFRRRGRGAGRVEGPQEPVSVQQTRRVVSTLERAMDRYTIHYKHYIALLPKTKPTSEQIDALRHEGGEYHSRVMSVFGRQYEADEGFRRERYRSFFDKLDAFSKLAQEYSDLLQGTTPRGLGQDSDVPLTRPRSNAIVGGRSSSDLSLIPSDMVTNPVGQNSTSTLTPSTTPEPNPQESRRRRSRWGSGSGLTGSWIDLLFRP
jgi:hypothetical protein